MKSTYIEFVALNRVEVRQEDVRTDDLAPWEVVVENEATLISPGTELSRLRGLEKGKQAGFPMRPGYAAVGRVRAKGDAVADFEVGGRVFYAGKHASAQRFLHGQNHMWGRLYAVPEELPAEHAVFGCLAEIAMTAPFVTELKLGDTVAVFGLGVIGNLAAQMYRLMGARVIGLDPVASRCELARAVGIECCLDASPATQVEALLERTGGQGANVTVDAVGHSAVVCNAVRGTALYGQVVLLGTPRAEVRGNLTDAFHTIHERGLVVRGAHMWRLPAADVRECPRNVPWAYETVYRLIGEGSLRVKPLISHVIGPEKVPAAYDGLANRPQEYWGVVIRWR